MATGARLAVADADAGDDTDGCESSVCRTGSSSLILGDATALLDAVVVLTGGRDAVTARDTVARLVVLPVLPPGSVLGLEAVADDVAAGDRLDPGVKDGSTFRRMTTSGVTFSTIWRFAFLRSGCGQHLA
jgi:hypothetical protein